MKRGFDDTELDITADLLAQVQLIRILPLEMPLMHCCRCKLVQLAEQRSRLRH
jgi:hypothetical protein